MGQLQQRLESRQFDVAGTSLTLLQDPTASKSLQPLVGRGSASSGLPDSAPGPGQAAQRLGSVGLVAWQCGFLLADLLLRRPPFRQWQDVRVVDLGAGTGVVGIALALAGADVVLADLPNVTPLTLLNAQANCDPLRHRATVVEYAWGASQLPAELTQQPPDVVAGADLVYDPDAYDDLVTALVAVAAPHTLVYLAIKSRGKDEDGFLAKLAAAGFAVQEVPAALLGKDYRDEGATYRVVRACKLG